jgi:hypothetical protein
VKPPPTRTAWVLEGELHGGHSVPETLSYLSQVADYEDQQVQRRALPVGVCLAGDGVEPRWLGRLRRLFGR